MQYPWHELPHGADPDTDGLYVKILSRVAGNSGESAQLWG